MGKNAIDISATDGDIPKVLFPGRSTQATSSTPIEFQVLGPTEARQAGQAIALSGARRRALVTRLLLDAGRGVSADTLLEDVWDGHAPTAASATLQSHVSQLRKVLGDRLQRSATGYILRLDAATVDAAVFEGRIAQGASQLAQGDVGAAARELRAALRLWQGRAFQDVADRPWAMPEAERLEELRRVALEQLLRVRLASGEHEQVVPEAEAAVEEHPLRERRWATLMLALYRSGRQAEALRAYQRLRVLLVDELGIDPSPPLTALEVAVLRQDPVLQFGQQSESGGGLHDTPGATDRERQSERRWPNRPLDLKSMASHEQRKQTLPDARRRRGRVDSSPADRSPNDGTYQKRTEIAPGYRTPLYLLAFDHRASFEQGLFDATTPVSSEVYGGIAKAKQIIFNANQIAIGAGALRDQAGILVDEEFGSEVARQAVRAGIPLAMPVERSGQDEFDFQYGAQFGEHIEAFDPTFAKVLVRYNPEGDADLNHRQTDRLAQLSEWLQDRDQKFLFELLVPPTTAQLDRFEDHRDYDRILRPDLVVETIAALQAGGVEPDIWKIEGLDAARNAEAVVEQAQTAGRDQVDCIVLGRGGDWDKVARWLQVAAGVPGFAGFAVGRTLWHDALVDHLAGRTSGTEAARTIADRYRHLIDLYISAAALPPVLPAA